MDPGPDCPEIVRMIVEIPKNSANKYEYDGNLGVFRLDRTLAEDRDPLDVIVLVDEPSFPGILLYVRPIGMLEMVDQDEPDQKILAVPFRNPRYDQIHTTDQMFPHVLREIEHFFAIYKELEKKRTQMLGWRGPREARETIRACRERYLANPVAPAGDRATIS
jgi:inorganic pyrophosphatase